jgi:ParB-like chromosome segregation protein Spo0J
MQVEMWPIDGPVGYARNARKIPQSAIDKVAASLKEFGWRQPIVVDEEGVIVVGHTRLQAAQKLGLAEVPVHVAVGLTATQIKAYRLADNRVHEEAEWDKELLALEIEDLKSDENFDLTLTGFDLGELGDLKKEDLLDPSGDESDSDLEQFVSLKWEAKSVRLTDEEVGLLNEKYDKHLEFNGVGYGFVRALIGGTL